MSSSGEYIAPTYRSSTSAHGVAITAVGFGDPVHSSPGTTLTSKINDIPAGNQSASSVSTKSQTESSPALPPVYTVQSMAMWQGKSFANTGTWKTVVAGADNGVRAINNVGGRSPSTRSNTTSTPLQDARDYECATKTQLLDSLCRKRKLGSPTYHLTPVGEDAQGVFNGHVEFSSPGASEGNIALILPEGVGKVCKIYTKKAAKEKLAENVLQYISTSMQGRIES